MSPAAERHPRIDPDDDPAGARGDARPGGGNDQPAEVHGPHGLPPRAGPSADLDRPARYRRSAGIEAVPGESPDPGAQQAQRDRPRPRRREVAPQADRRRRQPVLGDAPDAEVPQHRRDRVRGAGRGHDAEFRPARTAGAGAPARGRAPPLRGPANPQERRERNFPSSVFFCGLMSSPRSWPNCSSSRSCSFVSSSGIAT